jgi:PAS domain S-box-containing protein
MNGDGKSSSGGDGGSGNRAPFVPDGGAGGEMGVRVRAFDWSRTPLGPVESWPEALRVAVGVCLGSRFPMFVWWGEGLVNIYNDAYAPMLGKRHPAALGRGARESWEDIWDVVGPQAEAVLRRGEATWNERVLLRMERNGFEEDTYFTWSYSPIPDGRGGIGGVFCACTEETGRVLAERERERLAEQWRRADERSRTILESITDAFFALDGGWQFTYVNAQAQRVLDREESGLVGRSLWDEYPGLVGSKFEEVYRRVAAGRVAESITEYYPDHDRWYEVHAYPSPDGGVSVYFRNVTERKRDEGAMRGLAEELERQSRLFEQIASTTLDFIYVFDLGGRFLYANRRLLEVWGRAAGEAVGKDLYELGYPKWHADMHMRELREVIATKRPVKGEVPFTGGSGIFGVYEYIFTPVLGPGGEVEAVAGTTRDVTDRQRTEKELAEAKAAAEAASARWRAVVANMAEGVVLADAAGNMLEWNRAALEIHGYASAEDVRKNVGAVAPSFEITEGDGTVVPFERWPIPRLIRGEAFTNWEVRLRRTDRPLDLVISYSGVPIRDGKGEVALVLLTLHDVTAQRRAEEGRRALLEGERAARLEAEHASRMKDEFLATLSHELRTPLNAIVGWSQILRGGRASAEDLSEGVEAIERNARAQARIVEDLLDMSRIVSGKVRLDVRRVDVAGVVRAGVETVRPGAEAKGVRLQVVTDPAAGPVMGDPNRLQQVVWNLLANAVKFTPRGGRVQVSVTRVESSVEVGVSDTGEGIPAEFLPHVFERFRQADSSTTRRHGGLGLGLAIAKQLVELHGGTLRAASPGEGAGSTFTVALPVSAVRPEAGEAEGAERGHASASPAAGMPGVECPDLDGLRVVVVDDEPDARALVKRVLEACRATVRTAGSSGEALGLIESERPDVLVSDVGMPGEDGYALIRRVRALGRARGGDVPAVALTAYARAEDRIKAIQAGFQMHVVKPAEPTELVTVVASLAGRMLG